MPDPPPIDRATETGEAGDRRGAGGRPREIEQQLYALVNTLPVLLWEIDTDGVVTLSEGKALAGIGLRPGQVVGARLADLYRDRPDYLQLHARALAGESFSAIVDAGDRMLECHYSPRRDESGKIVGVVGMGVDVTARVRMEQAVTGLSRRLWSVLEEERRRIARELHDEAGQTMTALKLLLDRAIRTDGPDATRELVREAAVLCNSVLEELRRISRDLRPGSLDVLGLRPSLEALVERFQRTAGITARLETPEDLPPLDPDTQAAIYRFVQESLTNASRHARARSVGVRMERQVGRIVVETSDDGIGFVPEAALAGAGLGLIGMRERSRMLGGRVSIDSAPGRGTRVRLELPLSPTPAPATT